MLPLILLACATPKTSDSAALTETEVWHTPCPTDAIEQRLIQLSDVQLNVGCRGSGPTVVFLHGFPEFHHSWNNVMNELATEFRLIAPDQRGYNLSDKPEAVEAYHLSHLHQDIIELLPKVSNEPVILVAHDWGGPVGWMVAHTSGAHIRGFLATNGPHPIRFADLLTNDLEQQEASAYMDFFRNPSAEDFLTPEVLASDFDFLSEADLNLYMEAWQQPGAISGGLNWYRANDLTLQTTEELMSDLSPTISVPVHVMWGADDNAVLVSNSEGLDVFAPNLTVDIYDGVDHWIEHRIPEEVAETIRTLDTLTAQ